MKQVYTPYYCEENIYKLAQSLLKIEGLITQNYVVMITNPFQQTYIRQQKLGDKNGLVIWDYHVILIQKQTQKIDNHIHTKSYVFDYDTVLPWGMQFDDYFKLSHAFKKPNDTLKSWFHLIDTEVFIKNFASDRSHMKINGKFSHPPPDYPPIKGEQAAKDHNLFDFLDIENKQFGKWMQEDEIQKFFSARSI